MPPKVSQHLKSTAEHELCVLTPEEAAHKWRVYCSAPQPSHITLLVRDANGRERLWASSLDRRRSKGGMTKEIESTWVNDHQDYWEDLEDIAFVYSANDDLQCLAVKSPLSSRRLNRRDCLGKSLRYLDFVISEPRIKAIEQAIATNKITTYEYAHEWEGLLWEFTCIVTSLVGYDEILVVVQDKNEWQADYWKDQM